MDKVAEPDCADFFCSVEARQVRKAAFSHRAIKHLQLGNERCRREHIIRHIRSISGQIGRSPRNGQEFTEPRAAIRKIISEGAQTDSKGRSRKRNPVTIRLAKTAPGQQRSITHRHAFQRRTRCDLEDFKDYPAAFQLTNERRDCGRRPGESSIGNQQRIQFGQTQ